MRTLVALVVLLIPALVGATPVTDPAGWSLTIPDGYVAVPNAPGVLYLFTHGTVTDADFSAIQIQDLGAPIANEPIDHATVERGARDGAKASGLEEIGFEYRTIRWKTFDLDLVINRLRRGDQQLSSVATQVPLAKKAIQIVIAAPADRVDQSLAALAQIVSSVQGESSWLTDAERSERIGKSVGVIVGCLGVVGFLLWRRRRARRATVS